MPKPSALTMPLWHLHSFLDDTHGPITFGVGLYQ